MIPVLIISSCSSPPGVPRLAEIDVKQNQKIIKQQPIKQKSSEEIRQAYSDYLDNASVDDNARVNALNRLAEMELYYSNELLKQRENNNASVENLEDSLYEARLEKSIYLLSTSLRDYPTAKNNDVIMYQLAKALDQKGDHLQSIEILNKLVEQFPASPFFVESQFRIAEDAFSLQDYSTAEYAYTEVIVAAENEIFYEKSLFKRGWSRFKQQFYKDAVDDFLEAILRHKFDEYEKLDISEREQFDEYFRAVGLSFSYLGGVESLYKYFRNRPDFKYTYHTYSMLSDIYLKQERFTDSVNAHKQFIKYFPDSENIPYSQLKIIEIWKNSGFTNKIYDAIENFYVRYNPSSQYWKNQNENSSINRKIRRSLKQYLVLMSGFFHNKFQNSGKPSDYRNTERWYQRYLQHYSAYAQNDNIYFLYAELLNQHKDFKKAFKYYELAAYDNDLIINKDAAYAAIILSERLMKKKPANKQYFRKYIDYALKYAQQYPDDRRTQTLIISAAESAFRASEYKNTIELADITFNSSPLDSNISLANLKAESYFNLNDFVEAEALYTQLLNSPRINLKQKKSFSDKMALSIYRQAETARDNLDFAQAIQHFSRISTLVPATRIAATGLFDAIALNIQYKQWDSAIAESKRFQQLYPRHKLQPDVSRKLSVAYLGSDQGIKAAREFEKIARLSQDSDIKSAALWQAAELYENKNKIKEATHSYESYVKKYKKPFPQYIEAMQKLSMLMAKAGLHKKTSQWYSKMIKADKKALNNVKTDRTKYLVSQAYLKLARSEKNRFDKLQLTLPLKSSLKRKKAAMLSAVKLYGQSSVYRDYETTTEATYSIARIYKSFSESLLESDRPQNLNAEELDQYEILLEDKAFPFEDKSIDFFEINLARIQQGHFNDWIAKSLQQLIEIFPVRYNRKPKQDLYISEIY